MRLADLWLAARVAERAGRAEEAATRMRELVEFRGSHNPMTVAERDLYFRAHFVTLSSLRTAMRELSMASAEASQKPSVAAMPSPSPLRRTRKPAASTPALTAPSGEWENALSGYKDKLRNEQLALCHVVLQQLDRWMVPNAPDTESRCYYALRIADYLRYAAEVLSGEARREVCEQALRFYKASEALADAFPATMPLRLCAHLNHAVFVRELLGSPPMATKIARAAHDAALVDFDHLSESDYKAASGYIQALRDNFSLWAAET